MDDATAEKRQLPNLESTLDYDEGSRQGTAAYRGQVLWGSVVPHNRYSTDSTQVFRVSSASPGILLQRFRL
jgi:hypothetical protein